MEIDLSSKELKAAKAEVPFVPDLEDPKVHLHPLITGEGALINFDDAPPV